MDLFNIIRLITCAIFCWNLMFMETEEMCNGIFYSAKFLKAFGGQIPPSNILERATVINTTGLGLTGCHVCPLLCESTGIQPHRVKYHFSIRNLFLHTRKVKKNKNNNNKAILWHQSMITPVFSFGFFVFPTTFLEAMGPFSLTF